MSEKPKRPLSAYMLWLSENREKIKKENPGIKVTEIAKKGGELWRGMKDKSVSIYPLADYSPSCIFAWLVLHAASHFARQEWEAKAAKVKDEYAKAVKEYEANGGTDSGSKKRGKTPKKPAKKSKRKDESDGDEDESD